MSKNRRITFGPVYPVEEKGKAIEIPSEKTGEKIMPITREDILKEPENYIEIAVSTHESVLDEKGNILKRIGKDGKVLTQAKEALEEETEIGE